MEDILNLTDAVHRRQMKIIFDVVINHTSDKHPWSKASSSSKNNPKRNWYIWAKGKGRHPPNNWRSLIGRRGWNYHTETDELIFSTSLDTRCGSLLPYQGVVLKEK